MVVRKAVKWAKLRRKANSEKKTLLFFIITRQPIPISAALKAWIRRRAFVCCWLIWPRRGYKVDHLPADSQALMNDLLSAATNDRRFLTEQQIEQAPGKISDTVYRHWFDKLAAENQEQLTKDWGEPPGDVFQYDGQLLVPGMLNDNIFITVQPPRGFGENPGKILHSPDCADASLSGLLSLDTGYLAGRRRGPCGNSRGPGMAPRERERIIPQLLSRFIGDLPNVYPYLITIRAFAAAYEPCGYL